MKVLLIGGGDEGKAAIVKVFEQQHNEVVIIDSPSQLDEVMKDNGINFNEPIPITNPYKDLPTISTYGSGKEFVCKGRHQYVEFNGEWVCQCGRKTTD